MIVSELMEQLRECNQNAVVRSYTDSLYAPSGEWVEAVYEDIHLVSPYDTQSRHVTEVVYLQ